MSATAVGLLLLVCMFGLRDVIGSLLGGVVGIVMFVGLLGMTGSGELSAVHTPAGLARAAIVFALVLVVVTVVLPHGAGTFAAWWAAGAVLAALAAPRSGLTPYVAPLVLHVLCATAVFRLATRRLGLP